MENYVFGGFCTAVVPRLLEKPINKGEDAILGDMHRRGFRYLGPVTLYSHLQASGIINGHSPLCWKFQKDVQLQKLEYVEE